MISFGINNQSEVKALTRILPCALKTLVAWLAASLFSVCPVFGQGMTHTVEPGDTLWDICEYYYGDAGLWPKLWQMNPFVTNPHLLKEGDVITLLEGVPQKSPATPETKTAKPVEAAASVSAKEKGINISGLANVRSMGMLSSQKAEPWGRVFSAEDEKIMLSEGAGLYLEMAPGREVRQGDTFVVYRSSELLKSPVNRARIGYVLTFLGRVAVKAHVEKRLYEAELIEVYRAVKVGDTLLPHEAVSPCIELVPGPTNFETGIVAAEEEKLVMGPSTVVYLPTGDSQGVKRGQLLEIVKKREAKGSDPSARNKVFLPDLPIGRVLILETTTDTAAGVVVELQENIRPGAPVKSVSKETIPRALAVAPRCEP